MKDFARRAAETPLPVVRAFFLTPWIRELEKICPNAAEVLVRHNLRHIHRSALYEQVSLRDCIAFTEQMADMFDRDFLGIDLAKHFRLADLGPIYVVIALATTLRAALSSLARTQASWQTDTILDLLQYPDTTAFRYAIQDPLIWPRRQDAEFVLATIVKMVRERIGRQWRPVSIEFEHDVSERSEQLLRWFGVQPAGNCAANVIYIANEDMDRPLHISIREGDIAALLERHLHELMTSPDKPLPTWAAKTDFLIGKRLGRAEIKIEHIAAELNFSTRTLRRHLAREGTSFRAVLRQRRQSTMNAVLQSETTKLKELAYRLNYSDSATLSRAYKTWTGSSPRSGRRLAGK